ncbi:MAG: c-type cytochrome [Rhodospirillaceae bacterium]|nr:c-type cytochrome [Rhodospirillaceae bacterium]
MRLFFAIFIACMLFLKGASAETLGVEATFKEHCSECHGVDRLGAIGPALLPGNLKRLRKKNAIATIATGRIATQMPAFDEVLSGDQITALVDYIYTPLDSIPKWDMGDMKLSHVIHTDPASLPDKPAHTADPLNLFTVVETGDHHVTILDGDKFEPLWRFKSRFALHGGAKYSPDGRFVYLASRDGWVSKYDLFSFQVIAEIRVGINTRNIAISSDGKWVMAGNFLPHNLVVLNAHDLSPFKYIDTTDKKGNSSRVSAVYNAPPRNSFIAALKDFKEVWEMSYDPDAEPVYGNFVHSYRAGQIEAVIVEPQPFARRRIQTEDYLDDFFFDTAYSEVIGASRDGKGGAVYNLDVRRKIADLELEGMPHLGSGITWEYEGRTVMATPYIKEAAISIIDMETWKTIKRIETLGSGFFMRSHENTPYAWTDVFFGPHKDVLHIIDKRTLEIVKTIRPEPGKTAAHVEFTRDGKYALVSIWEMDGALVIYDAATFEEVKRLKMVKPSGKYNVYNKITYSRGTSH